MPRALRVDKEVQCKDCYQAARFERHQDASIDTQPNEAQILEVQ